MARPYVQSRRAAQVDDTRRRITEAAVALHGTLGPARTTISAIAAEAGVERLTVYRHFPDEAAIFAACSSHWIARHPPPDPETWRDVDGTAAVEAALRAMYAYYQETSPMWRLVYRDTPLVPAMAAPFAEWEAYLAGVCDGLVRRLPVRGRTRHLTATTLRHALDFVTWDAFAQAQVGSAALVSLMAGLVALAHGTGRTRPGTAAGSRET
jgi:AcrR family transcriptional regulator